VLTSAVVVGPPSGGKSTFAAALSERLGLDAVSIDTHRDRYYGVAYCADFASDVYARGGAVSLHGYESSFELHALTSLLETGDRFVIDTGGGLLWQRTAHNQARLRDVLSAAECTILCMPGNEATGAEEIVNELLRRHAERSPNVRPATRSSGSGLFAVAPR
jgi:shikimate kinase